MARAPESGRPAPASGLPRRIKLVAVDQEKLQANAEFEEMRLLRVQMKPKPGEEPVDQSDSRVVVLFFDDDRETKQVALTRAVAPKEPLRVEGPWPPDEPLVVTASYVAPRGFREEEFRQHGQHRRYYGYAVQVFYRDEIQDEDARPKTLLKEAADLPEPFHAPNPAGPGAGAEPLDRQASPATVTSSGTTVARSSSDP